MLHTLVIASDNAGKLAEIRAACAGIPHLPAQAALGIAAAAEPHLTFMENALAKARHTAAASNKPALADDSGLVVPALNHTPGVLSARYAGPHATDSANNAKLHHAMQNMSDRRAFYYAAIVLLLHPDDPAPLFAEGYWHGEITTTPRGKNGFGYDPLFYDPRAQKTGAEMTLKQKMRYSHRGKSLRRLLRLMRQRRLL